MQLTKAKWYDGATCSHCFFVILKKKEKYDSGAKKFSQIPTKHLSATIDGFTLQDHYMQGPKIPHSNSINR
ncbi:unnamed protein product [Brugia timori]|uniref:CKK domain-containing protein n=1 Tax=Brugia timori TaxID=42155 RepID=A0A0R3R8C3_9BILA|nr:unnamed protein product [Brugia timori]